MPVIDPGPMGWVRSQKVTFKQPLPLVSGQVLTEYTLAYETYGTLNRAANNALLICHALSGHQHAAGWRSAEENKPGWWDLYIGPGKPIDTNLFFVVCCNNLGGCHGSTGPVDQNPKTDAIWGPDFPVVTVTDWVHSQKHLADYLGIKQWAAVIGGSLGGMQALQWAISYPNALRHAIVIASAAKLSAQNIAFNEISRHAIRSDPNFQGGHYLKAGVTPKIGLMLARMLGHVTYLSDHAMREKFGRELKNGTLNFDYDTEFQVESYLRYQGETFSSQFDANTYLLMTKALDYFDPAKAFNDDLAQAMAITCCRFLVVSFSTDWRFAPERSREITNALMQAKKPVSYAEIQAVEGHDAFLMQVPRYYELLTTYLAQVAQEETMPEAVCEG